jgi:F-type H+-transporting ATPase subunit b
MSQDPPLIDIDGTFFVQLVVFIALAYLLSRLLFKPFLQVRNAREAGIEGARAEAARMDEEATARLADYEQKIGKARRDAHGERQKLHGEAVKREREIHENAVRQTQKVVADSRTRIDADAATTRRELEPKSREIAEVIAKKVLG